MKKIFTLALGLFAAATASAAITVTANKGEAVAQGSTVTAYIEMVQEMAGFQIFEINPEIIMTSDVDGAFTVNVKLVELTGKTPQFCWPDGCQPFKEAGQTLTATSNVQANVKQDLQIDNIMIIGEPSEPIYNKLDVEITSPTLTEPFSFTVVLSSEEDGVENIAVDNTNAPKAYFDLNGREVANPAGGLYIVRQGSKVTKEYIR